ncbi:MAG TPA: glyoxalase superfamily protein, partial [Ilumatobacteraceae bacterium]|nr:glyoxalase superfamily protein [Ilumatobacteraceae bacterium]
MALAIMRLTAHICRSALPNEPPRRQCGRMSDELIPILRVRDIASSVAWFERLGYSKEWEHRFEPTFPAFVSMGRGGGARI